MAFSLDEFMRVSRTETLPNGETVSVRVLSDVERNAAEAYGLEAAANAARLVRDPESVEYKQHVAHLKDADIPVMIDILCAASRQEWAREASQKHPLLIFPFPDNATPEQKADTLNRQRDHETEMATARLKYVLEREAAYREKMASLPREEIEPVLVGKATLIYIAEEKTVAEQNYTLAHAILAEDGSPRWSVEDIAKLPTRVIARLWQVYREVDSLDPWELTKSQPAGSPERLDADDTAGGGAG